MLLADIFSPLIAIVITASPRHTKQRGIFRVVLYSIHVRLPQKLPRILALVFGFRHNMLSGKELRVVSESPFAASFDGDGQVCSLVLAHIY
jgi:hypothetical protein